ncbi:MAG: VWA domain-containing protein [Acidobacteriota bacterium]|jgi:VWFA-related protein|nr:VWA domain-containing protein [Acidobacteriota bacterium]NLT32034.1 VWA domain-containing protein [Acidobacteriota bacterium]
MTYRMGAIKGSLALALILYMLCHSPGAPAAPEEDDAPRGKTAISVAVDLVTLQVLVTDTKGNVLTGLKPENFTIYEDKVKQEILNFSPVDANVTVVLLVEYSKKVNYFLDEVWDAMYYFTRSLRPKDWVAVVGYDMHTTIVSDFTQDPQKVHDAIRQFTYTAWDESNLSDAVIDVLDRTEETEGKVAVVLISTGLDTFSRRTYDDALKKCRQANASIYAIGLGQWYRAYADARGWISQSQNLEFLMGDNRLKSFAELTGGQAYFPRFSTELPAIFNNISRLLRSQYSIGYVSSNPARDGKFRKIEVKVETDMKDSKGKPLKLKVHTRKGYTARGL